MEPLKSIPVLDLPNHAPTPVDQIMFVDVQSDSQLITVEFTSRIISGFIQIINDKKQFLTAAVKLLQQIKPLDKQLPMISHEGRNFAINPAFLKSVVRTANTVKICTAYLIPIQETKVLDEVEDYGGREFATKDPSKWFAFFSNVMDRHPSNTFHFINHTYECNFDLSTLDLTSLLTRSNSICFQSVVVPFQRSIVCQYPNREDYNAKKRELIGKITHMFKLNKPNDQDIWINLARVRHAELGIAAGKKGIRLHFKHERSSFLDEGTLGSMTPEQAKEKLSDALALLTAYDKPSTSSEP